MAYTDANSDSRPGPVALFSNPSYEAAFNPDSLFSIARPELVAQLVKGFFYEQHRTAALLPAVRDQESGLWRLSGERIQPFQYTDEERDFFNPVCWEIHRLLGHSRCDDCSADVARTWIEGRRREVKPHTCWLGLLDIACPIMINDEVAAVVVSGQFLPSDPDWIQIIESRIRSSLSGVDSEQVIETLRTTALTKWANSDHMIEAQRSLSDFACQFQKDLSAMHKCQVHLATSRIVNEATAYLGTLGLDNPDMWWADCSALLEAFASRIGLRAIHLFARHRARYVQMVPDPPDDEDAVLRAKMVVGRLTGGELVQGNTNDAAFTIARRLNLDPSQTWLYLCEHRAEAHVLSTLLVGIGSLNDTKYYRLFEMLAEAVGRRAERASLVSQLQRTQSRFQEAVSDTAHDLRTPLQVVLLDLERLADEPCIKQDEELGLDIQQAISRAWDATYLAKQMQMTVAERKERVDIADMLVRLINDLKPLADKVPCAVETRGHWPGKTTVRGFRSQLFRALMNVIENAIKYSWRRKTVFLDLELASSTMLRITCSNYGIGIPSEEALDVFDSGVRAEVTDNDPFARREGSGRGLAITRRIIHDHGGLIEIDSFPADSDTRGEEEEYHRFETVVSIYLPVIS